MTGRDANQALAQYAAELGLDYTPEAIRKLRSRLTDREAREHMETVAALLAFADLVFVQDAAVPFTQQQATRTLNRAGGKFEKAKTLVRRRALRHVGHAERVYHQKLKEAWTEVYAQEANTRHAVLTSTYEVIEGSTGRQFTAVMSLLAAAGLDPIRERLKIKATRLVANEIDLAFPHPGDRDAKEYTLRRAPELVQRIDLFAHDGRHRPFRTAIEEVITEGVEALAELGARDGWEPDTTRPPMVQSAAQRKYAEWRRKNRSAAA